jgi:hypothetical protein
METKEDIINQIKELEKQKAQAEIKARIQDTFQHSYKIFLNSVYGFTGTQFSPIYNRDMAESVTLTGQAATKEMVKFTNKCLNKIGNTEDGEWVIAGDTDSVSGDTKIYVNEELISIEKLFEVISNNCRFDKLENGTEIVIPNDNFKTKSINGDSLIKNVSRHKVNKSCYSIKIKDHECLKITEDHSIMVYRNDEVIECKPDEIQINDQLIVIDENIL